MAAVEDVHAFLDTLPRERTQLLDNLGAIRRRVGPVTPELSDALADHMNIRQGEVAEVVSFYSYLQVPHDCVRVCTGPVCDCFGARDLLAKAQEQAKDGVPVLEVPCLGHCDLAPVGTRGDTVLPGMSEADVTHAANDGPSTGLAQADETLADYERRGGLAALRAEHSNESVLAALEASGLVGYGGAGFPTFRKWATVVQFSGPRVVVVNADEGEPGTIKDRYVMELRPHLLVEGMAIAARFVEAEYAIVYLREEYATSRARLVSAIAEFRAAGLLGSMVVEIVTGAGSYVCGEETAMLESLEGRRGMPRLRPPFPAESGYLGRPTLINNVETLAHIPAILRHGGAWFAGHGENGATGLRLWSVSGAVARPGCYEAPNGIVLRRLLDEYAGGATEEIGAIVPGGAASGVLAAGGARQSAHARGHGRVGLRSRLRRRPGLPRLVSDRASLARDDALLRRGVLPEVHTVSHRHAGPRVRAARAGSRTDGARGQAARGVAAHDGAGLDLRSRPGRARATPVGDAPLAGGFCCAALVPVLSAVGALDGTRQLDA